MSDCHNSYMSTYSSSLRVYDVCIDTITISICMCVRVSCTRWCDYQNSIIYMQPCDKLDLSACTCMRIMHVVYTSIISSPYGTITYGIHKIHFLGSAPWKWSYAVPIQQYPGTCTQHLGKHALPITMQSVCAGRHALILYSYLYTL